jgi:predicted small lipoprotein YifL
MRLGPRTLKGLLALAPLAVLALTGCGSPGEPAAEPDDPTPVEEPPTTEAPDTDDTPAPEITAYVVGYHWGWAVFDEDGNELDALEAPVGATIELFAVNDHASEAIEKLPAPVTEAINGIDWHERAHHDVAEGHVPDPMDEMGESLGHVLDAAHHGDGAHNGPQAAEDHGLMIPGPGVQAHLDAHADEPQHLVFDVEEEGTFQFICSEYCGYGHAYQSRDMLIVQA